MANELAMGDELDTMAASTSSVSRICVPNLQFMGTESATKAGAVGKGLEQN